MANAIYTNLGTPVAWTDTGGDEVLDLGGLTAGAVRVGAYHDFGADPRPTRYRWTIDVDGWDSAPVVGESVDLYAATSEDATLWDGPEAPSDSSDGAGVVARLPNLTFIGSAIVTSTTASVNATASGVVELIGRYIAPVVHNNTADDLLSTSDAHVVTLTQIYDELQ